MATKFHDKGFRMSVSEKKRQESTLDFRLLSLETTIQELILVLQEKKDKKDLSPSREKSVPRGSGPERIRKAFHPRARIRLNEAASVMGMSYQRLYALVRDKEIDLVVSLDERGKRYVFIDDLIRYLYPSYVFSESTTPESGVSGRDIPPKKIAGRPRKTGWRRI